MFIIRIESLDWIPYIFRIPLYCNKIIDDFDNFEDYEQYPLDNYCKTQENFNFLKKGKMVISVKIQNFSRSRMTKRTLSLESSHEI